MVESLIQLIMDNLFIVIIIVAGIIGFFKNSSAEQEQDRKQTNRPGPSQAPSGGSNQPQQRRNNETQSNPSVPATSMEDKQSEQLGRLAKQLGTETKDAMEKLPHDGIIGNTLREPNKDNSRAEEALRGQVKKNLGKTGLVNGIIMSEVLGSPRAKRPYRISNTKQRK